MGSTDALKLKLPQRIPIYGVWIEGTWLLCGEESGASRYDMPQVFVSRTDANDWLSVRPDYSDGIVVPLNNEADEQEG